MKDNTSDPPHNCCLGSHKYWLYELFRYCVWNIELEMISVTLVIRAFFLSFFLCGAHIICFLWFASSFCSLGHPIPFWLNQLWCIWIKTTSGNAPWPYKRFNPFKITELYIGQDQEWSGPEYWPLLISCSHGFRNRVSSPSVPFFSSLSLVAHRADVHPGVLRLTTTIFPLISFNFFSCVSGFDREMKLCTKRGCWSIWSSFSVDWLLSDPWLLVCNVQVQVDLWLVVASTSMSAHAFWIN